MTDSYQAIYDAVRSRISGGNISDVIRDQSRQAFDISHLVQQIQAEVYAVAYELRRPSVVFRPDISADGSKWSMLLGPNIQSGVVGFGDTPEEAARDFDQNWWKSYTPEARRILRNIEEEAKRDEARIGGQFGHGA